MLNQIKPKSEFSRNVFTLMTGTTIAQAVPLAISPVLTRIYSPEDFGLFALYLSIILVASSLVAGKYELSIIIPKKDSDAQYLVIVSIFISLITCIILFILIFLFSNQILYLLKNKDIKDWLYIIPANIFVISTSTILYYYLNRKKDYSNLAKGQIIQSSAQGSLTILLNFVNNFKGGLILGTFIGNVFYLIFYIYKIKNYFIYIKLKKIKFFYLIKKYKKFPKFMILSGLLENISVQLPIFMIGAFFGSHILGFFSLSQRMVRMPIGIIGSAIGNVFREEASRQLNTSGDCRILFLSTLKKLSIVGIIPFIFFYLTAPELFSFVFGEDWKQAGEYAQILTLLFYFQFITSPLSNMFIIAEKQKYDLYLQFYLVISVSISFIIGYYIFNSIEYSLYLFCSIYSLKYFMELLLSYTFTVKKKEI